LLFFSVVVLLQMSKRRLARSVNKSSLLLENPFLDSQLSSLQDLVSKRCKMLKAVERMLDKQTLDDEVLKNLGKRFPEISDHISEYLEREKNENNASTSLPKEQENLIEKVKSEYEEVENVNIDEESPALVVEQKPEEFSEQKLKDVILNLQEVVEKFNNIYLLKNEETKPRAIVHESTNTDDVELHDDRTKVTLYADLLNAVQKMGDDVKLLHEKHAMLHEKHTTLHEQFGSLNDTRKAVEDLENTVKNSIAKPVEVVSRDELKDLRDAVQLEILSLKLEVNEISKQLKDIFSHLEDGKNIISSKIELIDNQLTSLVEETVELKRCRKQEIVESAKLGIKVQ
ncbi:hypothetical protein T4C_10938, partial [Trichinella pseudospiralis]